MTDRPIIFSAPMVRALLDGRKTQTRRVMKKPAALDCLAAFGPTMLMKPGCADLVPYAVGDRLWVKESMWLVCAADGPQQSAPGTNPGRDGAFYRADHPEHPPCPHYGRRNSIHMPRWASRLTLTVTDVRVQRLNEISRGDAMEEGCPFANMASGPNPRDWFRDLWSSLHGPDAWAANPWIVALTFTVERRNIDA